MMMGGMWFSVIIFSLVVYMFITILFENTSPKKEDGSLSILNERYANGELDDDEYIRMKKFIESK